MPLLSAQSSRAFTRFHAQYWVLQILALTIVYAVLGRLSEFLIIPPGYTIAIFPPAGIALGMILTGGYRLLPGVALGAFLNNVFIAYENTGHFSASVITASLFIGCGACLQAGISSYAINQRLKNNLALDNNNAILQFFLIGGPIGCAISASIGITSLYLSGVLAAQDVIKNWLTWWMGDAFGVLTITPIVMIMFAQPRQIWLARRWNVMLSLLLCLLMVVAAFTVIRQREEQKQQLEFRLEGERISQQLQNKLNSNSEAVKNIERLYAASENVDRVDFAAFVGNTIQSHKEITTLIWAPKILHAQRATFEAAIVREGFPGFHFTERDPHNNVVPATRRDDYYPITYFAPFKADSQAFGYDMGSNAKRRIAIEDAMESGQLIASDPLTLGAKDGGQIAVLLFAAVYQHAHDNPLDNITQRKEAFEGVATSVIIMADVVQSLLSKEQHDDVLLRFYDLSYPGSKGVFFNRIKTLDTAHAFQATLNFGGRQYALQAQPSETYWKKHVSWISWITITGGLLFTGLIGVYLLMSTGHTYNVEALVTQRTAELHDKKERLDAILGNAAEGILTSNEKGDIESANQSVHAMLGYPDGHLVGCNIFQMFPDTASVSFLWQQFRTHPQTENDLHQAEYGKRHQVNARKNDGAEIPLELAITKVELGTQTLFVTMLHDLTEEKRAERLKSEFVSAVSHELRTPLTSIRGVLGLLVGGAAGPIPEKSFSMLKMANENAIRLTTLINDLLDFEKLEYGGMQFELSPMAIGDLLEKSIQANLGYAHNFNISMHYDRSANDDLKVLVDEQRFVQVMSNLLSNAIKFSREHGRVDVLTSFTGKRVKIEVRDYGIGISEEFKSSIFQKFSQEDAKAARKYAGTGLGLSLAKNMIEKMQGIIGFRSIEGEGSVFYIELPTQHSS